MSKYTTELRYVCEVEAGLEESKGYNNVNEIIAIAAPKIFNFDFPIFDEAYRLPLEKKIIRHFYTREISEETVGLWKLRLEDKMNMIMPYYNQLYRSELLQFNPLYDVDITREHTRENEGSEQRSNTESESGSNGGTRARTDVTDSETSNTVATESSKNVDTDTTKSVDTDTTKSGSSSSSKVVDTDTTKTIDSTIETSGSNDSRGVKSVVTTNESDNTGTDDETITESGTKWDLYSDTPQGGINGITGDNDSVANNTYLTNARKITDDKTTSRDKDTTEHIEGGTTYDELYTGHTGYEDTRDIDTSETGTLDTTETGTLTTSETEGVESSETGNITSAESGTVDTTENGTLDTTVTSNETTTGQFSRTGTNSGTASITNTEDYIEHVSGKQGGITYSKMLEEFRKTFLNIDRMVIDELNILFFGLW